MRAAAPTPPRGWCTPCTRRSPGTRCSSAARTGYLRCKRTACGITGIRTRMWVCHWSWNQGYAAALRLHEHHGQPVMFGMQAHAEPALAGTNDASAARSAWRSNCRVWKTKAAWGTCGCADPQRWARAGSPGTPCRTGRCGRPCTTATRGAACRRPSAPAACAASAPRAGAPVTAVTSTR